MPSTTPATPAPSAGAGLALHDAFEVEEAWATDLAEWAGGARRPGVHVMPVPLTLLTFTR